MVIFNSYVSLPEGTWFEMETGSFLHIQRIVLSCKGKDAENLNPPYFMGKIHGFLSNFL